jgi:uncharacterized protein (UPF0254 family)
MSTFECERLVQQYVDWVKLNLAVQQQDGMCIITTPLLDRHHDYLQIYAERNGTEILLSDDGYTLRDLKISGLEINTDYRTEALNQAIRPFGVDVRGDELSLVTGESDFPQRKHDLLQAMLAVGDLIHLAQATVVAVFREDVEKYLREQRVRFISDIRLTGTSGLHHLFDFVIPESDQNPERYLKAINNPNRDSTVALLFAWGDVQSARVSNAKMVTILNDEGRRINADNAAALDKYGVEIIRWTERDSGLQLLRN